MNGIHKAINQKKFRNDSHQAQVSILYLSILIKNQLWKILKKHHITEQQFNILRILRGSNPNPCNIGILKERMLDKMSDTSRLVDRLVNFKLAFKRTNSDDKRAMNVYISAKGLKVLEEIDKYNDEFDSVLSVLNKEEIETLNALFEKVIDANLEL